MIVGPNLVEQMFTSARIQEYMDIYKEFNNKYGLKGKPIHKPM